MSMWANYLREKTDDLILETDKGFATYRYLPMESSVYIVDLYVLPDFRKENIATSMADTIVEEARGKGFKTLIGSVVPSAKNSTISLRVLLGYGMSLASSSNDFVVFKKEI